MKKIVPGLYLLPPFYGEKRPPDPSNPENAKFYDNNKKYFQRIARSDASSKKFLSSARAGKKSPTIDICITLPKMELVLPLPGIGENLTLKHQKRSSKKKRKFRLNSELKNKENNEILSRKICDPKPGNVKKVSTF